MARCEKMLNGEWDEIVLHGLGAAINRAINLALQLQRRFMTSIEMDIRTSTVQVNDDMWPLLDELDTQSRSRNLSAIHIRLFRPIIPSKKAE